MHHATKPSITHASTQPNGPLRYRQTWSTSAANPCPIVHFGLALAVKWQQRSWAFIAPMAYSSDCYARLWGWEPEDGVEMMTDCTNEAVKCRKGGRKAKPVHIDADTERQLREIVDSPIWASVAN